jgi:beta-lactamase regulating signal transducer with metallopeptidase domain
MKSIFACIPDNVIDAMGWTIFHSVWQGLIIGLIMLLILRLRRNLSSQSRYLLGVLSLAAIFSSSLLTFVIAYHPGASTTQMVGPAIEVVSVPREFPRPADGMVYIPGWKEYLTGTFDYVSIIWFIGVLLLTVRLAGGLLIIQGMRWQQVSPLPAEWESRLRHLARGVGLRRPITFLQSRKVRVPTVIGFLKPVVLVPAMIISGWPAEQLETIMVHELAHIRRHDFLINILQSIMEAIFFYHPMVWIISDNIRQERENCCDDQTIMFCGKVSLYARALASLGELQIIAPVPSIAITGNKKSIKYRVERLINNKKMKNNATEKIIAGMVLLTSVLIITLGTGATLKPAGFDQLEARLQLPLLDKPGEDPPSAPTVPAEASILPIPLPDAEAAPPATPLPFTGVTLPAEQPVPVPDKAPNISGEMEALPAMPTLPLVPKPSPAFNKDTSHQHGRTDLKVRDNEVTREFHNKEGEDQEMKFVIRQGKVKELYVDGKKVPENEFPRYQDEIDVTMDDLREMETDLKNARTELDNIDFNAIKEDVRIDLERFREENMEQLQEEMKRLQDEQLSIQLDKEKLQQEIQRAMENINIDREEIQEELMKAREEMMEAREEMQKALQEHRDGAYQLDEEEYRKAMEQMERNLAEARENLATLDEDQIREMMDEAVKSIQKIDYEQIQKDIELAIKEMKEIDMAKIEKDMQEAFQHLDKEKHKMEQEKRNMDDMIEELEKLELEKK